MKINWDKIKAAFGGDETKAKQFLEDAKKLKEGQKQKFMDYKTSEGALIKVEPELAQGAMAILEDGSAAPDGEHMLEGGVKIRVKEGRIEEIISESSESGEMGKQMETMMKAIADLKKDLAATKAEFAALKAEKFVAQTDFLKFRETVAQIVDLIDFDAPGGKPAKKQNQQPNGGEGGEIPKWKQIANGLKEE